MEAQPGEAADVVVGAAEGAVVLDRQGGQMGVIGEIARCAGLSDQQAKEAPVAGAGLQPWSSPIHQGVLQPALHEIRRLLELEWPLHQPALRWS